MHFEVARLVYSGFFGIYLFALIIFLIFFLHLKIKNSAAFLGLTFLNTLYILLTIFFIENVPVTIKAFYLFPLGGFLGFLSFHTYFTILEERFHFHSVLPRLVKINCLALAIIMGVVAFFSSVDEIRELFIMKGSIRLQIFSSPAPWEHINLRSLERQ